MNYLFWYYVKVSSMKWIASRALHGSLGKSFLELLTWSEQALVSKDDMTLELIFSRAMWGTPERHISHYLGI